MSALVNIGEGGMGTLLRAKNSASLDDLWDEEISSWRGLSRNDVNQVHHVHPDVVDPANDDPLVMAEDPATADLSATVALVEQVIGQCQENPGALASKGFRDACRLIRTDSPEDWMRLRVAIKRAKPSGVLLSDIDDTTRPPSEAGDESSIADELVALTQALASLFHAKDGTCFASLREIPRKTYRLDNRAFSEWLAYAYYQHGIATTGSGRAASDQAIRNARTVLVGIATHEGPEQEAYLRTARQGDSYYIDLGSDDWSVIEVNRNGWHQWPASPLPFWRSASVRPLPVPVPGGDLGKLWDYANIPPEVRTLVLAWMLETWRPETPFPMLELVGSHGSAKSSTQAKLRQCVDPNAVDLRAAPKSVEDLFVSAGANWLASYNNLSHLSASTQDALCNLATGGGFAARTLYSNADETLIESKRPVILNGIVPTVTAQDLADRVIHIELPTIAVYRQESEIELAFQQDAPSIVGGLFDLFAATLAKLPDIQIERPPRMADFARLGEAMHRAQGVAPGEFVRLYAANRRDSTARGLEASPVAVALRSLVEHHQDSQPWEPVIFDNTMGALLERLGDHRDKSDAWPKSARGLGDVLRRQIPALAQIGIRISIAKPGKRGVIVRIVAEGEHGEQGERDLAPIPAREKKIEADDDVVEMLL